VRAVRVLPLLACTVLSDIERGRLSTLRETLAQRRRTLNAARLLPPQLQTLTKETQELAMLSQTIARARSGLVQELVEVFHVVEVGGRPAVGGRPGARGEWTVGGLVLPVPGDVRRTLQLHTTLRISSHRAYHRIPTGSHQRRDNTYHSLSGTSYFLPRHQTPF
jgi:hypothetical protein